MSLRVLELDTLQLSSPGHLLNLSVIAAADIRVPTCISSLGNATLVKALTSRNLWVTRGVACHFNIQVNFNGKPLDCEGRANFLESMGFRISDAQFWTLLSMSASFDIWDYHRINTLPDFSIKINPLVHNVGIPTQQTRHRAWDLGTFDIKPPDIILGVEFERLQIRFEFSEIHKKAKRATTGELVVADDVEEVMLLDHDLDINPHAGFGEDPDLLQQHLSHSSHGDQIPAMPILIHHSVKPDIKNSREESRRLPQAAIEILEAWVQAHADKPYPSKDEKSVLERDTGLSKIQINGWFDRTRRRLSKTKTSDDEMLLRDDENDSIARATHEKEDSMLSSQGMENTPSLTSQSSIASSVALQTEEERPPKRPIPSLELPDKTLACQLGEAAIQVLVSGYIGRGLGLGGVQVEKPPPSLSLSRLVPLTFCPGFKESMAHNAHFLPTISHAICVSWLRNIQSPNLKEKLKKLANLPTISLTDATRIEDSEAGTTSRLASVVQSRLWVMMQRRLFDPSDAAKIWRKSAVQASTTEEDGYPDLLETFDEGHGARGRVSTRLDDFEDDEDEFEDLLFADDEDLLACMEERERLSVERKTEEMLLGNGWDEDQKDDGDVCLLDGDAGDDPMLL